MGGLGSTPSPNPSETLSQTSEMSSSSHPESKPSEPEAKTLASGIERVSNPPTEVPESLGNKDEVAGDEAGEVKEEVEGEQEEEGECGFCLFMKGGGCRESFIAWEKCIEEAEKKSEDIVEKCFEVTGALKKCMEAHYDYYEPILRAEKEVEEEAVKEFQKEKEAAVSSSPPSSAGSEEQLGSKGLQQGDTKSPE